jgi:hypothetical protein
MIGCSAVNFFTLYTFYTDAQYFMISEFKQYKVIVYKQSNAKTLHS